MNLREIYLYLFFFISNIFGRELISTNLIGIPNIKYYHIFFISFSILNYSLFFKKFPNKKIFYAVLLVSIIPFYLGLKQGNEGVFNFLIVNFSFLFYLWGYYYLNTEEKIEKFIKFLVFCFFINLIYTEIRFQFEDKSIFFSLTPLYGGKGIRQSSDTLNSLAIVSFLYYIFKKDQKNKLLILLLILFVIYRYNVRSSFLVLFIVLLYYLLKYKIRFTAKLLSNYKIALIISLFIILMLFVNINEIKELIFKFSETNYDLRGNIIWRLTIWYDNLVSILNSGNLLVNVSGMNIDYDLTRYLGGWGYVNPHNSYIFIFTNYGLVYLLLYLLIPFKLIFSKNVYRNQNSLILTINFIILMYFGLSLGTATFELPYQGSTIWFLIGGAVSQTCNKKY